MLLRQIQHICIASIYARIFYFDVDYYSYGKAIDPIVKGEEHTDAEWEEIISNADAALKQFRKELRSALLKDIKHREDYGDIFDQDFSLAMQDYIVGYLVERKVKELSEKQLCNIRKSIKCEDDVPNNKLLQQLGGDADDKAVEILQAISDVEPIRPDDPFLFRTLATALVNAFK